MTNPLRTRPPPVVKTYWCGCHGGGTRSPGRQPASAQQQASQRKAAGPNRESVSDSHVCRIPPRSELRSKLAAVQADLYMSVDKLCVKILTAARAADGFLARFA